MDNGYMQEIRARILAAEDGAVFVAPDFADIATPQQFAKD